MRRHQNHRATTASTCSFEPLEGRQMFAGGSPDNAFGQHGRATMSLADGSVLFAEDVAVQSDGKTVVAGYTRQSGKDEDFAVGRFNVDGTPDLSFGGKGAVRTDVDG